MSTGAQKQSRLTTLEEPPVDTDPGEEPTEAPEERKATRYVILRARALGDDEVFVVVDTREASNGNAAKRAYVEEQLAQGDSLHGASLVAVPERSWEPEDVVVEQRIKIG